MVYLYDVCDQISDFCHQQLLRKMRRKISWTDGRTEGRTEGRTDRGKTVYSPPPSGSGGIKRSLNEIPIGSNGKLLLPCGGHLGYAIGTKLTNLVEDHPVIISIMLQFHHLTRRFSKFQPIRAHYWPWQLCWISDLHQNRGTPNEHFCQVWSKSVLWFQRRR
jgi:hypothetical protein